MAPRKGTVVGLSSLAGLHIVLADYRPKSNLDSHRGAALGKSTLGDRQHHRDDGHIDTGVTRRAICAFPFFCFDVRDTCDVFPLRRGLRARLAVGCLANVKRSSNFVCSRAGAGYARCTGRDLIALVREHPRPGTRCTCYGG